MPSYRSTPESYRRARALRKEPNSTENHLWARLRNQQLNGISIRRQHPIGKYIVDFCAPQAKLIIELDGSQHMEHERYDSERTKYLESQGYRVLRFWNNVVEQNIEGVVTEIMAALEQTPT
jgi:very-short-patch-repair endonuclease